MVDDEEREAADGIRIGKVDQSVRMKPAPVSFCPT
jgi:hypothetical protein